MNFRTLTTACAGLALFSGIVTATLWHQLHTVREQTAAMQMQLAESAGAARVAPAPTPGVDAGTAVPVAPGKPEAAPANAPPPFSTAAMNRSASISEQDLLKDPDYRKARLATLRSSIAQSYPGLAEELGMSQQEADAFFELMAENQMALSAQSPIFGGDQPPDPLVLAELTRNRQALQRQQGDSIRAMLGESRYSQWQYYQQTRSVRMQASSYANAIAQAAAPLDGMQLRSLTTAMLGEQKSLNQDTVALGRMVDPSNPQSQAQAQQALKNRQAASNQRILEAAASALTAQQTNALRAQMEQQEAMSRSSARARELVEEARSRQQ